MIVAPRTPGIPRALGVGRPGTVLMAGRSRAEPGVAAAQTEAPLDQPLEPAPETDAIEERVQVRRQDAVAGVLGPGVVSCVVTLGSDQARIHHPGDEPSVPASRAVRPLVDLVRVRSEEQDEPELPGHRREQGRDDADDRADRDEEPRRVPVGEPCGVAGIPVVQVVAPRHQLAEHRQVFVTVGVLQPVHEAGEEVGDEYAADTLCSHEKHGALQGPGAARRRTPIQPRRSLRRSGVARSQSILVANRPDGID